MTKNIANKAHNGNFRESVLLWFKTTLYWGASSIPSCDKTFSLQQSVHIDSVALRARPQFSGYLRGLLLRVGRVVVKQPGCQADDSSTSSAEAKNEWSYTSVPLPAHLNDVHRNTFVCTIPRNCRQNVNSNDLYVAGTRFESQLEHRIFLAFFVFFIPTN
jgi:hypothetical protein